MNRNCERPDATALVSQWTTGSGPHTASLGRGTVDSLGHQYWLETGPFESRRTTFVSADRDGGMRFSTITPGAPGLLVLVDDDRAALVLQPQRTLIQNSRLEVRSTRDGALLWRTDRNDLAPWLGVTSSGALTIVAAGSSGALLWINVAGEGAEWLVGLEAASGALRWSLRARAFSSVVADDASLYAFALGLQDGGAGGGSLLRIDHSGRVVWSDASHSGPPVATSMGTLLTGSPPTLRDVVTGDENALSLPNLGPIRGLLTTGALVVFEDVECPATLTIIDRKSRTPLTTVRVTNDCLHEPMLTSRDTILLMTTSPPTVRELGLDGSERWACRVPVWRPVATALVGSRLVVHWPGATEAFELGVPGLASRGWVTTGGSQRRGRQAAE